MDGQEPSQPGWELRGQGHQISAASVAPLLRRLGYSLQANAKTREGANHPDRDAHLRHINETVKAAITAGQPTISVDTKKKERLDEQTCPNGIKVSDAELAAVALEGNSFHPECRVELHHQSER